MKNQAANTAVVTRMTRTFNDEILSQLPSMKEDAQKQQASLAASNINHVPHYQGDEATSAKWGLEEVRDAMRDIADISEKTMLNFIILGNMAKAVKERDDMVVVDKIQIGMLAGSLTPEVKSLFKTWGYTETNYGYKYFYTPALKWDIKIPVEIRVIKGHYSFFENLDMGYYWVDTFKIPNPFDKYWKVRQLVK